MTNERKEELVKLVSDLTSLSNDLKLILDEEVAERDSYPPEDYNDEIDIIEGNVGSLEEAHELVLESLDILRVTIEDEE